MSEVVKDAIRAAIDKKRRELEELESELRRVEREETMGKKLTRRRRRTGIKAGSLPAIALEILKEAGRPVSAAELADAVSKDEKPVKTNILAAALKRYIDEGRYFRRTQDGLYEVLREQ